MMKEDLPQFTDWHDVNAFYYDWGRRGETLERVSRSIPPGSQVLDAGSAPGFTSIGLRRLGYEVVSLDIDPAPYDSALTRHGITVVKGNLETDAIPLADATVSCVVFTEVIEHLHPYKMPFILSEINRVLSQGSTVDLTTPNLASLSRRLRLLLGKQPTPSFHTREMTLHEVCGELERAGFQITLSEYSKAYNVLPYGAKNEDLTIGLWRGFRKYPNIANLFRLTTYPAISAFPQLQGTLVVEATKSRYIKPQGIPSEADE